NRNGIIGDGTRCEQKVVGKEDRQRGRVDMKRRQQSLQLLIEPIHIDFRNECRGSEEVGDLSFIERNINGLGYDLRLIEQDVIVRRSRGDEIPEVAALISITELSKSEVDAPRSKTRGLKDRRIPGCVQNRLPTICVNVWIECGVWRHWRHGVGKHQ